MIITAGTTGADSVHCGGCQGVLAKEKACCCCQGKQMSYFKIKHHKLLLPDGNLPKAMENQF
jgi:hypothetical protein